MIGATMKGRVLGLLGTTANIAGLLMAAAPTGTAAGAVTPGSTGRVMVATTDDGPIGPADFSNCPRGLICVYASTNGGELPGWKSFVLTRPGNCTFAGIPTLVGIRGYLSAYNRTGLTQKLWLGTNCTGGEGPSRFRMGR
ncbi:hypothetical protein ACIHFB_00670 [Streptomyces sp. NPDC051963]|uniref:hypothetical protein n=1 Tax=Streptomyces sp. NPDC051963 TaxID=3365678 RepID=UPI0037D7CC23